MDDQNNKLSKASGEECPCSNDRSIRDRTADYFPLLATHEVLRAEQRVSSSSDKVALCPLSGCRCAVDWVPGGLISAGAATEQA